MYLRIGLGLAALITAVVFWVKWSGQQDPDTALRQLIVAGVLTLLGIFIMTSKRLKKLFDDFEQKQEIEDFKYERARGARGGAEPGASRIAEQSDPLPGPEAAKSLAELEKLLYTRTITEEEYRLAKDRVFLTKSVQEQGAAIAHLQKLAELHADGIISDSEFNAAKLKALGFG